MRDPGATGKIGASDPPGTCVADRNAFLDVRGQTLSQQHVEEPIICGR
jgi:hypothetical protein